MIKSTDVLKEAIVLKKKKDQDYNQSSIKQSDYFPFGHLSYQQMLHTKLLRIRAVTENKNVNFESIEDSLLDLINYSAMYVADIRNERDKKELEELAKGL